ncbi:hypothetical protein Tco_1351660 [Tanacetum coccineum]
MRSRLKLMAGEPKHKENNKALAGFLCKDQMAGPAISNKFSMALNDKQSSIRRIEDIEDIFTIFFLGSGQIRLVWFWLWLGFGCGWVPVVEGRGGGDFDGGEDVGGGVVVVVVNGGFQPERLARCNDYLSRRGISFLDLGLESVSIRRIQGIGYGVLGFLGVGTTFDIFQNIHILYLQYGVLVFWIRRIDLVSFVVFGECRHGYAVSSLMDTAYWLSE